MQQYTLFSIFDKLNNFIQVPISLLSQVIFINKTNFIDMLEFFQTRK